MKKKYISYTHVLHKKNVFFFILIAIVFISLILPSQSLHVFALSTSNGFTEDSSDSVSEPDGETNTNDDNVNDNTKDSPSLDNYDTSTDDSTDDTPSGEGATPSGDTGSPSGNPGTVSPEDPETVSPGDPGGGITNDPMGGNVNGGIDPGFSAEGSQETQMESQLSNEARPTANIISISPNPAIPGSTVYFYGDAWDDGCIIYWEWRSNKDGVLSTNQNFTLSTLSTGNHTISLRVKDNLLEWSDEATQTLIVNWPPIANAGEPYFGWKNKPITFDGSHSTDIDGHIVTYQWNFGDGTTASDARTTHSYAHTGIYTVKLTVTDDLGGTDTNTVTTTVVGIPPVAQA
ncbi:MAG: PKD domain-containing protein, partial [Methanobacteriota archaeon]